MMRAISGKFDWETRDLLVVAAFGVVPGVALLPVLYAGFALRAVFGPLITAVYTGLFYMPGLLALYVVRKPGASILNGLFVALVWVPITPFGLAVVIPTIVARIGSELPFALTRYQRFETPVLLASGAAAGLFSLAVIYVPFGYHNFAYPLQTGLIVGHAVGGAVLCGLVAKTLGDRLADTGVLASYPVVESRLPTS